MKNKKAKMSQMWCLLTEITHTVTRRILDRKRLARSAQAAGERRARGVGPPSAVQAGPGAGVEELTRPAAVEADLGQRAFARPPAARHLGKAAVGVRSEVDPAVVLH